MTAFEDVYQFSTVSLPEDFCWADLAEDVRYGEDLKGLAPDFKRRTTREDNTSAQELETCLDLLELPEDARRIEARLAHIRRSATLSKGAAPFEDAKGHSNEAIVLRKGAIAANAVIPGSPGSWGDGIHLGDGYVLRHWDGKGQDRQGIGSDALGYHLARTDRSEAPMAPAYPDLPGSVRLDPRPGKVLKHEAVHALFVAEDGEVRVAMNALRVVGHGPRHVFMTTRTPTLATARVFCFNESWQFLGMSAESFANTSSETRPTTALAVLRPTAIWDDLVARADLGCVTSADALSALARKQPSRASRRAAESFKTPEFGYR